jgi:PHD/YefM family antitoxin component YafN of YafNO toxin-antitoxin module
MNQSQVLSAMIEGLYRDRASAVLPAGFGIAPAYGASSARAEFLVFLSDNRFDDRKDAGKATSLTSQFQKADYTLSPVDVQMQDHKSSYTVIPAGFLASIEDNASLVTSVMDAKIDEIYGGYTSELQAEIAGAGLVSGSAFNLTTGSEDVVDKINDTIRQLQLASNKAPNTIYMGQATFHALMNQDQVQEGSAIAGWTSSAANVRRLGSATPEAVYAFFRTRFGLNLVVDDRTILDSTGTPAYAAGDNIVICHANGGSAASCFKTFHLQTYTPADLVRFLNQDSRLPDPEGQAVAANAVYKIKAVDPSLGALCSVTL